MPNSPKVPKTKEEYDAIINKDSAGMLVVVDFHATWCGPCKMIAPKFQSLLDASETIVGVKVDVDELEDVAADAKVSAMPTFIAYRDGEKVGEVVGANEKELEKLMSM
ncbi:uncharacterized protein [Watersipora subatra]|uniref:uncharacterized protein n=1 Tax=Watersipora subatra TaxID=2589382 RepID=UPI00355BEEC0